MNQPKDIRVVTRKQCVASVIVWAALTEYSKILYFLLTRGKNKPEEVDILVGACLPWAQKHFKTHPWSFQQDFPPTLLVKKTKGWLSKKGLHFILMRNSPIFPWCESPYFWGLCIPKEQDLGTHNQRLETPNVKLQKEWIKVPQQVSRDTCEVFSKSFQLVIDADGGQVELYFTY